MLDSFEMHSWKRSISNLKEEERNTYFYSLFHQSRIVHSFLPFCSTTSETLTSRVEVNTKNILYTTLLISAGG